MESYTSFDETPAPQTTPLPWKHLAGLLACAAAVFLFTFGAAIVGFGLGVSGGVAPVNDNEARLVWRYAPVAAEAETTLPPPTTIRPRREAKTPPPEFRIIQANATPSEPPAGIDWEEGWAPIEEDEGFVEDFSGDEIIPPDSAPNN